VLLSAKEYLDILIDHNTGESISNGLFLFEYLNVVTALVGHIIAVIPSYTLT